MIYRKLQEYNRHESAPQKFKLTTLTLVIKPSYNKSRKCHPVDCDWGQEFATATSDVVAISFKTLAVTTIYQTGHQYHHDQ